MDTKEFLRRMKESDTEKGVESTYHEFLRQGLSRYGGKQIEVKGGKKHGVQTDGLVTFTLEESDVPKLYKIIVEAKDTKDFSNHFVRSQVLAQALGYIVKLDDVGQDKPNIILVGDRNSCFLVHVNYVMRYLNSKENYKFDRFAPNQMSKDLGLVGELANDVELMGACHVRHFNSSIFSADVILEDIISIVKGTPTIVEISDKNISAIFEYFITHILRQNTDKKKYFTPREQQRLFMTLVQDEEEVNPHSSFLMSIRKDKMKHKKANALVFAGEEVEGNPFNLLAFKERYTFELNAEEKKKFTAICDRLIEDADRRMKGDFYTPMIWVNEAHKMLAENLGADWKDEYMVWDCAWGTGNLTRDYKFGELYASTLFEADVEIGEKYNPEATKFQYDFLNDDVEEMEALLQKVKEGHELEEKDFYGMKLWQEVPDLILGLLNGKKLLFLINPPYGTANTFGHLGKSNYKNGIANSSEVNALMKHNKIGASSQQLYAQFIYRTMMIEKLIDTEVNLGMYSPLLYLTGGAFEKLRNKMKEVYSVSEGMFFNASEFADVSDLWGISFILFNNKNNWSDVFSVDIKKIDNGFVFTDFKKNVYSLDGVASCSDWVKEETKSLKTYYAPQMKSALNYDSFKGIGRLTNNSLGYYFNVSNIVEKNNSEVFIVSSCTKSGHGVSVLEKNYNRFTGNFTARRLITGKYATWENGKDEYMIPDVNHPKYKQWEADCIVYSLFNTASNQSSLRDIDYNDKKWDIYNHFFFMSKDEMKLLALGEIGEGSANDDVYYDLENHAEDERFVYKKLQEVELSDDAQAVLNKARELVRESFKYREVFNMEKEEYQINTWDAGWYQIKGLLKAYMPEELKEFNQLYKKMEDRMRPLVVELGFLYDYPGYEKEVEGEDKVVEDGKKLLEKYDDEIGDVDQVGIGNSKEDEIGESGRLN